MDAQIITYGTLGGMLLGGVTILVFLWNIHTKVIQQHSTEEEKLLAIRTKIDDSAKELHERINRTKDEFKQADKELDEKIVNVRLEVAHRSDLRDLEKSIEGNVQKTVDTAIAQLEAKLPQMMMDALKTFKPSS